MAIHAASIRLAIAVIALVGFGVCGSARAHRPKNIKVVESLCSDALCGNSVRARMAQDGAGNFFGFMESGGFYDRGAMFKLYREPGKSKWKFATIYNFCHLLDCRDGEDTESETPIVDTAGNLYGTTAFGGTYNAGTFFKLTPNWNGRQWKLTVLYNFCAKDSACHDGGQPIGSLTYQGASSGALYDGSSPLYGANEVGGAHGSGVVFSLTQRFGRWHEQQLYAFCSEGGDSCTDGRIGRDFSLDSSGDLIGVGYRANPDNVNGFVFKLAPNSGSRFWTQTILHNFCSLANCADGSGPAGGIVQDASGNLYGLTSYGGNTNCGHNGGCGVLYRIAPDNSESVLHAFCSRPLCRDGIFPTGGLLIDSSGILYGAALGGGHYMSANDALGTGTIFKYAGSALDTLWTFCLSTGCPDGANPTTGLTRGPSGNLFGVTGSGGAHNFGTIYELNQ
jgi:uncharacterized repeat protein (TIGR03803 family)